MKVSFYLLLSPLFLTSIVFAQFDLPSSFDIGASFRTVSFSCFKKDPDCVVQGLEHSNCIGMGGYVAHCENLNAMYKCHSCLVDDARQYRYTAYEAVKNWCAEKGGKADVFKENMNLCIE